MIRPRAAACLLVISVVSSIPTAFAATAVARGRHADWWPAGRRPPFQDLEAKRWDEARAVLLGAARFVPGPDKSADPVAAMLSEVPRRGRRDRSPSAASSPAPSYRSSHS